MSGHNRWSKLKRAKAVQGVAKGKLYNKLIKELSMAAKLGGGDATGNPRLRVAIALAKEANMPSDNIQRAIKKGTGELEGAQYEEIVYEGYGPGGVAVIVESLTDNRNRTATHVRNIFSVGGGNLGAEGSVGWMFHKRGVIVVPPGPTEEEVLEHALEAGAEDVQSLGEEGFGVQTVPQALHQVASALEGAGVRVAEQRWTYLPQTQVRLEGENARKMLKLMTLLEDDDDVQQVHANFEIDEALMDELA